MLDKIKTNPNYIKSFGAVIGALLIGGLVGVIVSQEENVEFVEEIVEEEDEK